MIYSQWPKISKSGGLKSTVFFYIFTAVIIFLKTSRGRPGFLFHFREKKTSLLLPKKQNAFFFWKIVRPYYKSKTPCMSKNSFVCLQCGSSTLRRNHFRKFQMPSNSSVVGKQAFTTSIICSIIVFWCATVALRNHAWIWIWALDTDVVGSEKKIALLRHQTGLVQLSCITRYFRVRRIGL